MQLPRGRFHSLLKSTTSRVLIEDMSSAQFTGICTIVLGGESATLVLSEGLVVLAEYGDRKGQHVVDAILEDGEREVAAELNLLTPEQIRLALEFNRPFATRDPGAGGQGRPSPGKAVSGGAKPSARNKAGAVSPPVRRPEPFAEVHRIPMPGVKPARETTGASQRENDEVDALVQNIEEMNVEQLVSSFRVNCKDMLRKIHLDHLIQDNDT